MLIIRREHDCFYIMAVGRNVSYSCDKFATPLPKYDSEWENVTDASSDFSGIKFGVLSQGRARPTEVIAVCEDWNE